MIDLKNLKFNKTGADKSLLRYKDMLANFIIPGLAVIISILVINFLTLPKYRQLPQQKSEMEEKLASLATLEEKRNSLKTVSQNISLLTSDSEKLDNAIEVAAKAPEYLEQLRRISSDNAIASDSVSFSRDSSMVLSSDQPVEQSVGSEIKVTTSLTVSLDKLPLLLRSLENSIRLSRVHSVAYTTDSTGDDFTEGRVNLYLSSPYLENSATVSDANAPYSGFDLFDPVYRGFIEKLDRMRDYSQEIDIAVSQEEASSSVKPLFVESAF